MKWMNAALYLLLLCGLAAGLIVALIDGDHWRIVGYGVTLMAFLAVRGDLTKQSAS